MKEKFSKILVTGLFTALFILCASSNLSAEDEKAEKIEQVDKADTPDKSNQSDKTDTAPDKDSLMERIDFGNSYILGQSIKSGAVYLLHRKKSNIKSMLKTRDDYRKEILEDLKVSKKR
ncbi:MAG: hypothetical protein JW927_14745 [Deltaproteobacteria bacterium]|nr:hypothetical protein [Deltaproteobacteria bacterium]